MGDSILNFSQPVLTQPVGDTGEAVEFGCVRLDGYCGFRVAAPKSDLRARIRAIEAALVRIRNSYIKAADPEPELAIRYEEGDAPDADDKDASTAAATPAESIAKIP